ncbi:MAG: methyltransferase domain-containing protein [Isosphaerales bacterium]
MKRTVPAYFDFLIDGFERGLVGRSVHLGHWDQPSGGVTSGPDEFARAQDRLDEVLLGMADFQDGQSVLDVGCGFGGSLQKVDRRFRNVRLVGVNIDPRQLAICRQLGPREGNVFEWIEADACDLPFADATFDRVLCIEAMFHFASRRVFFREAARVLRPGGVLVISDLDLDRSATRADLPGFCIEAMLRDGYGPWPEPWGEEVDGRALGGAAGLTCTRFLDATAQTRPSHRFTVPAHLGDGRDPGEPTLRAALMLKWLHEHGHLRCVYMRFDKPPDR